MADRGHGVVVLGGGDRHDLRADGEGHLGDPQPARQLGARLEADRPARAGEQRRVDGARGRTVPSRTSGGRRRSGRPTASPSARSTGTLTEPRSVTVASGPTVEPVQRRGHRRQRHGQDDDAGELPADADAARGGGVAGRRVDVPAGHRAPGRDERRGERAAELARGPRRRRAAPAWSGRGRWSQLAPRPAGAEHPRQRGRDQPAVLRRAPRSGRRPCGCCGAARRPRPSSTVARAARRRGTRCARPGRRRPCRGCCSPPRARRRAAPWSRRRARCRRR